MVKQNAPDRGGPEKGGVENLNQFPSTTVAGDLLHEGNANKVQTHINPAIHRIIFMLPKV
jgi:hypothetical protein